MGKKMLLLLSLILIALGSIYFTSFRGMPEPDRQPYRRLGTKLAEETAGLLGKEGRVAILINREFGSFPIPSLDIEMKVFTELLEKRGITIAAIEKVEMQKVGLAYPAAFLRAVGKQKDVDVIVSVVGFPMAANQDPATFKKYKAKFIVAAPYEPAFKTLLQEGIIQLAILPKSSTASTSDVPPQTFDAGFQVFTAQNAGELP